MSVYEQPYPAPSDILGVYRYLLHCKQQRVAREELERLLMPEHLPLKDSTVSDGGSDDEPDDKKGEPPRARIRRSVDEAIKMRLAIQEGDNVLLHPGLSFGARSAESGEGSARRTLSVLLLSQDNEANHDLAKAIAWYLGQDVHAAPSSWGDVDEDQRYSEAKEELAMNKTRFGQLLHWSRFLGFAWAHAAPVRSGQKGSKLAWTPDPYWHLRWRLPELFAERRSSVLPLSVVADELALVVPVLEGGAFRTSLEGRLLPAREPHQFSLSSAHAWLRLHDDGLARLAYRSDGDPYVFPIGDSEELFTEVFWQGGI